MDKKTIDHLLERCLREMEWTGDIDAVLRRHPEHAEELRPLLELASTVREEYAEVPEPRAQLAEGWVRLRREAGRARRAAAAQQVAVRRQERRSSMRLRLVPTLVSVVVVVVVWMGGMAGVALAADAAGPGDPLYGLDRTLERIQLRLTYDPEAATQLRLRLTEERMQEIQKLVRRQDQERLREALGDYGDAVGALAGRLEDREVLGDPARISEMNQVLARNEEQMEYAFRRADVQDDDADGPEDPEDPDEQRKDAREGEGWWTDQDFVHPVASRLAELYENEDVGYEVIVGWFADGFGFGEIMHALQTSEILSDREEFQDSTITEIAQLLLDKRTDEKKGWGQVWQEYGLIGRPEDSGLDDAEEVDEGESPESVSPKDKEKDKDTGPPDHAGPKDKQKDKDTGPPDHAGPKDKEKGKDTGPPDHAGPKGGDGASGDDDNGSPPDAGDGKGESSYGSGGK